MIEEIKKLAQMQNQLAQQAYTAYVPLVENIIASQIKDVNQISLTLDYMLDFCFDDKILTLYRKLCRYLCGIDQETTAYYVNAYRERWDEEGTQFGKNKEEKV